MMVAPSRAPGGADGADRLRGALAHVARLLPAQGPINVFVHHNVLHAFEGSPFEEAVAEAARIYGCEPFWPAERYRAQFETGRISEEDLRDVIEHDLGSRAAEVVGGVVQRRDVAMAVARYGIPKVGGQALKWRLREEEALRRFRVDMAREARAALSASRPRSDGDEATAVNSLWNACLEAVRCSPAPPRAPVTPAPRHRDVVLAATGLDTDDAVHALLVRFVSAYLDQGLALWSMEGRERGILAAFIETYRRRWLAPLLGPWGRDLVAVLEQQGASSPDALASIAASLDALGVSADEEAAFLLETALALKGWAGMVWQIEQRPDRLPVRLVPARLADFLAVRLLIERAVLMQNARDRGADPARLDALRDELGATSRAPRSTSDEERAFSLFHLAQLVGLAPVLIERLAPPDVAAVERELVVCDDKERMWLHASFELHLRTRFFDALAAHRPGPGPAKPHVQALFCVDEREESMRRHLEEVAPSVETLSTAGFFGVPMYFQGDRDARPRPLAPVGITPRHFVPVEDLGESGPRGWARRLARLRARAVHVGSRGLFRGALVSVGGALSLVPLVLRVLFRRRLDGGRHAVGERGRLLVDRAPGAAPIGEWIGFSVDEMVDIVARVLTEVGLEAGRIAPLVVVVGHAADSLNNPHRSAYDCGACGGGPGGPNARALASMANRAEVRRRLAARGLVIPEETWFVGAEHNTTDDSITWFDERDVPEPRAPDLARVRAFFDEARGRNAEERCRRFGGAPVATGAGALDEARSRRTDLAEPRPEYNHATNAFCFVGRRARTRGLFLDRRAFLVSYDPTRDDGAGATLRRILEAVVPVVAGINLEYLFGTIDNEGYGAGTKLPHNVVSLLGVMNGAQGDLRTGLWAQTVEIHEPVRLTIVVETTTERLTALIAESALLSRLVENRWIFIAALAPHGSDLFDLSRGEPRLHVPRRPLRVVTGPSSSWFRGKGGHLELVEVVMPEGAQACP